MQSWRERCEKCVRIQGDYFEKWLHFQLPVVSSFFKINYETLELERSTSHDVRPSLNCRTHERTFFTSITPSLHVSLNCRWISIGFMLRKWRNQIITRCSSNVNVAISVSKTLLLYPLPFPEKKIRRPYNLNAPRRFVITAFCGFSVKRFDTWLLLLILYKKEA